MDTKEKIENFSTVAAGIFLVTGWTWAVVEYVPERHEIVSQAWCLAYAAENFLEQNPDQHTVRCSSGRVVCVAIRRGDDEIEYEFSLDIYREEY